MEIEQIIQALNLKPLPDEGGLYVETYRSEGQLSPAALPEGYPAETKPFGTAILYLLTDQPGSFSALHRLPTDEIWHYHLGDGLELTLLGPDGSAQQVNLGPDILNGQHVQLVVPAGYWQGASVVPGGRFALVGTTMAPGFTPGDYQPGDRAALLAQYPQAREHILALTRV